MTTAPEAIWGKRQIAFGVGNVSIIGIEFCRKHAVRYELLEVTLFSFNSFCRSNFGYNK